MTTGCRDHSALKTNEMAVIARYVGISSATPFSPTTVHPHHGRRSPHHYSAHKLEWERGALAPHAGSGYALPTGR